MNHVDRGKKHVFGEINITPLTDIFLVLLIIVIVVAPIANQRRDIKIPKITTGAGIEQEWLTVEIASDGSLYIDAALVKPEELTETLKTRLASLPDKFLVVRGDRTSKSKAVMELFQAAKEAGFERVMLAGEAEMGSAAPAPTTTPAPEPNT
ncbi:MAG: biopolymer transporter ExbD [Candidatus Hydrogenedentes bacterium]|nr:biopolymer transporter ExbD [Candidatus Hydrogenedentota bacterium]